MKLFYFVIVLLFVLNFMTENSAQKFKLPPGRGIGTSCN